MVHHGADRADREPVILGRLHVDDEYRQAVGALPGFLFWRSARQQDHQIGIFGAAGPDFLAIDDIAVVAFAPGEGLERGSIGAAGRLGDAERLQPQFAGCDLRQPFCLLLVAAVPQQRAHGVHLSMAAAAVAPGTLDLFQDRRGCGQFQAGTAIFFRDQHRKIPGLGQRIDKGFWINHFAVELAPVFAGELRAQFGNGVADVGIFFLFCCSHLSSAGMFGARIAAVQNAQSIRKTWYFKTVRRW